MDIVFKISGEGGGICIKRQKNNSGEVFLYEHSEFDPLKEGPGVYKTETYPSFQESFELINNKYPWYKLHIATVHGDYRTYIANRLIEKLNKESIGPEYLDYRKMDLEHALGIELTCSMIDNKPIWNYTTTDDNNI